MPHARIERADAGPPTGNDHTGRRRTLVRAGVVIGISQAAFSIGNLMLLVAVSRVGGVDEVGRIGVVLIVFQVALGLTRAVLGEVALVRTPILGCLDRDGMVRSSLVLGAVIGAVLVGVGALLPDRLAVIAVLGCFMPLLVTQDSLRYASFAETRAARAAVGDVAWFGAFLAYVCVRSVSGPPASETSLLVAWCAFGAASILIIDVHTFKRGLRSRSRWIRDSGSIAAVYLPEYGLNLVAVILPSLFVALNGGLAEVGGLRLAMSFLGPVSILWTAIVNFSTPLLATSERSSIRIEVVLTLSAMALVIIWCAFGVALPKEVMMRLAGDSWSRADRWIPWLGVGFAVLASYSGALVGLRARNMARHAFRWRLVTAPGGLIAPSLGFRIAGPAGFGAGLAIGSAVTSAVLWRALYRGAKTTRALSGG